MNCRIIPLLSEHIAPLAQALHTEWHDFAPWADVAKIHAYYQTCLNDAPLPVAFAAVDEQGRLKGSAALKRHDIQAFSNYEYWLGDVFVLPEYRGEGVGKQLVQHCLTAAREMKLPSLYLYTPDMQAVYAKFGWQEIAQHWYNGETVSIMKLDL
ncbi:N-acetyltransferase [Neisseria sp. N95_16]|uniref:GNAT family N-acetyltransferase n=1 Tax=Neisseria brasiliensis TaxID=2666100 RepID=A0A5Q3S3I2_9NEIS|nr:MULTISPECIES: GNAT family N-acetyltransferase [Neisseria]MRN38084.1 GNAT family N-acetyltransferase [Neisseria brasiliensis]PJO09535.1 N-acetyltransferase [Neisseria sp. N95_16]PJO77674.1 N-acetyltransferase [Neisseria sp. N177_16]QGL25076.1 GNAT family N-acetyltransferase [Neisseria brasiliensis]